MFAHSLGRTTIGNEDLSPQLSEDLRKLNVEPTRDGIRQYFSMFSPDSSSSANVEQLIEQLGSEDFQIRSNATTKLAGVSHTDIPLIRKATHSTDLEISLRAKQVLKMFEKGTHLKRLHNVLAALSKHNAQGFTAELCVALNVVQPEGSLNRQFQKALTATSTVSDSSYLKKRLQDKSQFGRHLILNSLGSLKDENLTELLVSYSENDTAEDLRLSAAVQLAVRLDRRCLKPLVQLLTSEVVSVRSTAHRTLRNVTGQKFKYFASAKKEKRDIAIKKWNEWLATKSAEAVLFENRKSSVEYVNRMIVSSYSLRKVIETDMEGNVLRTLKDVGTPMGVFGSEDGKILVCDYGGKKIRVFDSESKEIFTKALPGAPLSGEFLENGNILVGTTDAKQVLELDPEGETVWKATVSGRINVVHRTFEGTTLVSMLGEGKVVELDENGKVIFELVANKPNGVRRLENGNTLVCLYGTGEVCEYDSEKNIVWKATGLQSPARAQRMPDGNTIIYHRSGVVIFDEAGKKVRDINANSLKTGGVGSIHYF